MEKLYPGQGAREERKPQDNGRGSLKRAAMQCTQRATHSDWSRGTEGDGGRGEGIDKLPNMLEIVFTGVFYVDQVENMSMY